jgi:hypothetical protein
MSIDGSTLDVPDEKVNAEAFGYAQGGRGEAAYPQIRFVALAECATHALCLAEHLRASIKQHGRPKLTAVTFRMVTEAAQLAAAPPHPAHAIGAWLRPQVQLGGVRDDSEQALARQLVPAFSDDMLVLADRLFYGYDMWREAVATGAKLLWRVKSNLRLPCEVPLADGSYLSTVYASDTDRRHQRNGIRVRVIEYRLEGVPDAEPQYRLITNLLDAAVAPAVELAALYHRRWKIEEMFDEIKTHLCDGKKVLRSKTPDLVRQEFYALMLTHAAIRRMMYEAAQDSGQRPEDLSFVHAVHVLNRRLPEAAAVPP